MSDNFGSKPKPPAKKSLLQGSEVLQRLFENGKSPLSEQFLRWKIWGQWKTIVGPTIGEHTEPVGYSQGLLYVWVKNSTWLQQLYFVKDEMRKKVNAEVGYNYAKDIRFTMDRRGVPRQGQEELKHQIESLAPAQQDDE
jgi:predicted nucleic acid-binding Zn ribbon protein